MTIAREHFFLTSLAFTVIVETLVIFLLSRYLFKDTKTPTWRIVFAGLFASFATIPYVWFVFPTVIHWTVNQGLIASESFAFIVEAIFYRVVLGTSLSRSILLSLIANAGSFFLSRFLRGAGIWIDW